MVPGGVLGWSVSALLAGSGLVCGSLLLSGWRHRPSAEPGAGDETPEPASLTPFVLGRTAFAGSMLDVTQEVRAVLQQMAPRAMRRHVQFEMAVPPELGVHADRQALRAVLCALADHAMRQASGGRVLVSALRSGGRVQIAVVDDGAAPPPAAVQQAALRDAAQVVALQGGTIEFEVQPGAGTCIVLRLPEAANAASPATQAGIRQRPVPAGGDAAAAARQQAVAELSWDA